MARSTHEARHGRRTRRRVVALLTGLALTTAACGGGGGDGGGSGTDTGSGSADEGDPVRGGKIVYALEAENGGGWCMPEAQLAAAGIQVARTIYDTLTIPDENGEYKPFLAESVESNPKATEWTIKLREGITFHDGTPLTAEVVKNNLDAYRGQYPNRAPLLFIFVFLNIKDVKVVDDLTVQVTTKEPWGSFPAHLYQSGRLGIVAQAQLDDKRTCDRKLIGTGPFKMKEWRVNDHFTAEANPDYWRDGVDGKPLPYLDEVEFRPVPEAAQILNGVESGQFSAAWWEPANELAQFRRLAEQGSIGVIEGQGKFPEVGHILLNVSKPPFDNILARQALAYALDLDAVNEVRNAGISENANGPFGPGVLGEMEDTGYPSYDADRARELVEQYEQETGRELEFVLSNTNDVASIETSELYKDAFEDVGMKLNIRGTEQTQYINDVIAGEFQAAGWRNHPGFDPDTEYVWWYSFDKGNPVNFNRFNDDEIDAALDKGRSSTDPDERKEAYEAISRRFAEQVYDVWTFYTDWHIAHQNDVHGLLGPDLPDGSKPFPGLTSGTDLAGAWVG
ncbi:MAG: ABC transporter substrate-binding protein [Acidimicrobiia bacterium]|nr:ABC transporter substrate-binding protein [Acidimicrobiia bacterium]